MQRTNLLITMFLVSTLVVVASVGVFLPNLFPQQMMTGMSGMMGQGNGMGGFVWPTFLSVSIALLIVTVSYILLYPSIKYSNESDQNLSIPTELANLEPMKVVMRVVKPDERAALEVLIENGGFCLQKDITFKASLSKLKTHRIVARLAERGIVQVKKVGRTNEISVPAWLRADRSAVPPDALKR